MKYLRCKCSICNKRKTKNFFDVDGESKPICIICRIKLANKEFAENEEKQAEYSKKLTSAIYMAILFVAIILVVGLIAYSKIFSDFKDIAAVFTNKIKFIYFLLFFLLNYFMGLLFDRLNEGKSFWFKAIINFLFTFEITLVGCVVAIREDITFSNGIGFLIIIGTLVLSLCAIVLFILNHKSVNKKRLYLTTVTIQILSTILAVVAICVNML